MTDEQIKMTADCLAKHGHKPYTGIGRASLRGEPMAGMVQLAAWDDDSPCQIVLTANGSIAAKIDDYAKAAIASMSDATLK